MFVLNPYLLHSSGVYHIQLKVIVLTKTQALVPDAPHCLTAPSPSSCSSDTNLLPEALAQFFPASGPLHVPFSLLGMPSSLAEPLLGVDSIFKCFSSLQASLPFKSLITQVFFLILGSLAKCQLHEGRGSVAYFVLNYSRCLVNTRPFLDTAEVWRQCWTPE